MQEDPTPGLLITPLKSKLAPIASCETLSETSEFVEGDVSEDSGAEDSSDSQEDTYTTAAITITTATGPTTAPSNGITFSHISGESCTDSNLGEDIHNLMVPRSIISSYSSDTLTGSNSSFNSSMRSPLSTAASSDTLVPASPRSSPQATPLTSPKKTGISFITGFRTRKVTAPPIKIPSSHQLDLDALALSPATSPKYKRSLSPLRHSAMSPCITVGQTSPVLPQPSSPSPSRSPISSPKLKRVPSPMISSLSSPNIITNLAKSKQGNDPVKGLLITCINNCYLLTDKCVLVLVLFYCDSLFFSQIYLLIHPNLLE